MKVAFATTDGINVDEHFGRAETFAVYELTDTDYRFVEIREFAEAKDIDFENTKGMDQIHGSKVEGKVAKLADCKIIYLTEIGGPSAARLIKRGIMPIKVAGAVSIGESLEKLLATVKASPPPWLKKALNS